MLIYILSRNPELYSTDRLIEAGVDAGHEIRIINHMHCDLLIENGQFSIIYNDEVLKTPDYIVPRIGANVTRYGEKVIRHFEKMGVKTLTPSDGLLNSRDKFRSLQLMTEHQIPMPNTYFSNDLHDAEVVVNTKLQYPFVLKLIEGTQGLGVYLIKTEEQAKQFFDHYSDSDTKVLLQEFIKESSGRDVRVIVAGRKVIAAMERIAPKNEFRSNIHRGAVGHHTTLSDQEKQIAIRAIKSLGLKLGGVDLMRSNRGPLVLEVNSSPGLEGIEKATQIDVAEHIFKFIQTDKKRGKPNGNQ